MSESGLFISWAGSQGVYAKCSTLILKAFAESSVPWRKKGTSFPVHVTLSVRLVPFSSSVVESLEGDADRRLSAGLAHVYFVDSGDVDAYRSGCRAALVEWFAGLREAGCSDWLIVLDSTRAREARARAPLLEKLRADFSKYSGKIVEVEAEAGKAAVLVRTLRDLVVTSMDATVTAVEANLQAQKDRALAASPDWSFFRYLQCQMRLSEVYGGLGLLEQVVADYDELNALFSLLVHSGADVRSGWMRRLGESEASSCPRIALRGWGPDTVGGGVSLMELRTLLLSNKLGVIVRRFGAPGQSGVERSTGSELVLNYAAEALERWEEDRRIIGDASEARRWVWELAVCLQSLAIAASLQDPANVPAAAVPTSQLWLRLCRRLRLLGTQCRLYGGKEANSDIAQQLTEWLDLGSVSPKDKESAAVFQLQDLLSGPDRFAVHFQKLHESGVAVLKHFGRRRQSKVLGAALGDFLLARGGEDETALSHFRRLLRDLAREGWTQLETRLLTRLFPLFHQYPNEQISQALTLSTDVEDPEKRIEYFAKFVELAKTCQFRSVEEKESLIAISELAVTPTVVTPGEVLTCTFVLTSAFPAALSVDLNAYFGNEGERSRCGGSVAIELDEKTGAGRVTVGESRRLRRLSSLSPPPASQLPPTFAASAVLLQPGPNSARLSLCAPLKDQGFYRASRVELVLGAARLESVLREGVGGDFRVAQRGPTLELLRSDGFLSGLAQRLELKAFPSPALSPDATTITFSAAADSTLRFMASDGEWSRQCRADVGSVVDGERGVSVEMLNSVGSCRGGLPPLLSSVRASPGRALGKGMCVEMSVEWGEFRWDFALSFSPALVSAPEIRFLEDQTIVMCAVTTKSAGIALTDATVICSETGESAKLLNTQMNVLSVDCPESLVWNFHRTQLGKGDSGRAFAIALSYTVAGRTFNYTDSLDSPFATADYEVCSQITSRPLLCRVGSECAMVVSLRGLGPARRSESLQLRLESPHWRCPPPGAAVAVKESGLAQTDVAIVPLSLGFLPLPTLRLCLAEEPGTPLTAYSRTAGRQVHVLAPLAKEALAS